MKFLCLGYFDRTQMDALPEGAIDVIMRECGPHMTEMYKTRQVVVDAGLETKTKGLRRTNGKLKVTDGPFVEAKEMIGGAFIIEAADMDDAVRVASLHPTTRVPAGENLGWALEIRPIHYFEMPERAGDNGDSR